MEGLGRVHIITGPGKGKTTAAFGLAMRAAGHGYKVCIIQFLKTGATTGEVLAARGIDGIQVFQFGTGRWVGAKDISDEERRMVASGMARAKAALTGGEFDIVIMDEINVVLAFDLASVREVLDLVRSRKEGVEVVLTGRSAPEELIEYADYVSVIEDTKHPYDRGVPARKGIEW